MKRLVPFLLCFGSLVGIHAQSGIPVPEMAHCDQAVQSFLTQYGIPGATLAVAKDGKLVYARAFGQADLAGTQPTQPYHLFRIASLSKPITAIAVMKLIEDGQLSLSDKPFGPNGLLANHPYLSTVSYSDNRIDDITVQHLLEHSAGWDRNQDCVQEPATPYTWTINHCDPIGFPLHVTHTLGETNPVREEVLIRFLLEKGLAFAPGADYAYSNIGYLVLGEIIATVSGLPYEEYVKQQVLEPLSIYDLHLGKNLLADKRSREAEYEGNGFTAPSVYGDGNMVPWEYGGWNLEAMDAHGGWVATARDLVRLLSAVDGFATRSDMLSAATIQIMTTPSANNAFYAKGWSVNTANHWWHTGGLDGTASIWVRTSSGYLWALIVNKRMIGNQANQFWSDLDNLPWNCVLNTTSWPSHDLFDVPEPARDLAASQGASTGTADLQWSSGNGDLRLVVAREGAPVDAYPLDGQSYSSDATFGQGADLGNGQFVVYQGSNASCSISGLDTSKTYHFRVFEYHERSSTGNLPLYQVTRAPADSLAPAGASTSIDDLARLGIRCFPNPGTDQVQIQWEQSGQLDRIELRNLQGRVVLRETLPESATSWRGNTAALPAQVYLLTAFRQGQYLGSLRWIKQ